MYIILVYDIVFDKEGPRIHRNVFQICKMYLNNIQRSVFEGEISEYKLMELKSKLKLYIRDDKDSLIIFKSRSKKWLEKEFVGLIDDKTSNFF